MVAFLLCSSSMFYSFRPVDLTQSMQCLDDPSVRKCIARLKTSSPTRTDPQLQSSNSKKNFGSLTAETLFTDGIKNLTSCLNQVWSA